MTKQYTSPIDVIIDDKNRTVILADGRGISNPLEWFTWLMNATAEQRANYELSPFSIDWLDLDNGVDIEGMLRDIKPKSPISTSI